MTMSQGPADGWGVPREARTQAEESENTSEAFPSTPFPEWPRGTYTRRPSQTHQTNLRGADTSARASPSPRMSNTLAFVP